MKKNFEEILKKSKALLNGENSNSFEYDLFKGSEWYFLFNNIQLKATSKAESKENFKEKFKEKQVIVEHKTLVLFLGDGKKEGEEDLLYKMILAMKLKESEFVRLPLGQELLDCSDLSTDDILTLPSYSALMEQIENLAPAYVVSLGAVSTNILLNSKEKMSAIHGNFFSLRANNWNYQMIPIFHPDFLLINPNMKRTAWMDLQKLMQLLGKI